jgi:hypothetical protein
MNNFVTPPGIRFAYLLKVSGWVIDKPELSGYLAD